MELTKLNKIPKTSSLLFQLAGIVTIAMYVIYRISIEDYVLAIIFALSMLPLALSMYLEWHNKANLAQKKLTLILICIAISYSCFTLGYKGLIYLFPTIFVFYFLFNLKEAVVLSFTYAIVSLLLALNIEETFVITRFSLAILNCLIFGAIFSHIITRQKLALLYFANTDELTGVYNRKRLMRSLTHALQNHAIHGVQSSILLLDLDYFKQVNDEYGHLVGDEVLRQAANVIKRVVPCNVEIIRYGGEEFLIILLDLDTTRASDIAQQLLQSIAEMQLPEVMEPITCSIGISSLPATSIEHWLAECDKALYRAKSEGRNRSIIASKS
ncbi:GGDEF domain-containing protein [Shewanella sp. D64]|uniref:GGDEF domain-containing protein n=1 Tax=unclassified Shewanella TaxID=196818 RepID=UPI0022BA534E|nr:MULTISPECIES: GGDEF domain-containing protein [unclassified Shewanella]MEC4724187.1 GGDEF domain-containing protein [Shewanella sp. D64]MEC4736207.1 GGDEF domain-containing protein [Shewanella sp. E94]WBJ97858.1 GGDEF domain-containing protein [Shewanella sp. MTB7]